MCHKLQYFSKTYTAAHRRGFSNSSFYHKYLSQDIRNYYFWYSSFGYPMIKRSFNIAVLVLMLFSLMSLESCSVKNENLLSNIGEKKIITIYSVCPHKNGERIQDQYLFKIKNDRISLTEKHGDRIQNKISRNLELADELEALILNSKEITNKDNACEYYVKCGIQESNIYLNSETLEKFETLVKSFSSPV